MRENSEGLYLIRHEGKYRVKRTSESKTSFPNIITRNNERTLALIILFCVVKTSFVWLWCSVKYAAALFFVCLFSYLKNWSIYYLLSLKSQASYILCYFDLRNLQVFTTTGKESFKFSSALWATPDHNAQGTFSLEASDGKCTLTSADWPYKP